MHKVDLPTNKTQGQSPSLPIHWTTNQKQQKQNLNAKHNKKKLNKLKAQSTLERMCSIFAKFTTNWSIRTRNETFSLCKVHNKENKKKNPISSKEKYETPQPILWEA